LQQVKGAPNKAGEEVMGILQQLHWLRLVRFHFRVFLQCRWAFSSAILNAERGGQTPEDAVPSLVRRLISIGNTVKGWRAPIGGKRLLDLDQMFRLQHYGFIVTTILKLPERWLINIDCDDLKQLVQFAEIMLRLYQGGVRDTFASTQRKVRGITPKAFGDMELASLHEFLGSAYFQLNPGDAAYDLETAFRNLRLAAETLNKIGHLVAQFRAAKTWTTLAEACLRHPVGGKFLQDAEPALFKARAALAPFAESLLLPQNQVVPQHLMMDQKAWRQLPNTMRLRIAAQEAYRAARGKTMVMSGVMDPRFSGIVVPALMGRINWLLGITYRRLGNLDKSIAHLDLAIKELSNDPEARALITVEKGFAYLEAKTADEQKWIENLESGETIFNAVLVEVNPSKLTKAWLLATLGIARTYVAYLEGMSEETIARHSDTLKKSCQELRRALRIAKALSMIQICQEAAFLLGGLYRIRGMHAKEYQALSLSSRLVDRLRARSRTPRLKHYWTGAGVSLYDQLVYASARYKVDVRNGQLPELMARARHALRSAIKFSERGRSAFLQEELANRELLPRGGTYETLKEFHAIRRMWHHIELDIREREALPKQDPSTDQLRDERNRLEERYFASLQAIRDEFHDPDYDPDRPVAPVSFTAIQSTVDALSTKNDTAIVEYHISDKGVFIFVVLPKKPPYPNTFFYHKSKLSREEIDRVTKHWEGGYWAMSALASPDGQSNSISHLHWERGYLNQTLNRLKALAKSPWETITQWERDTGGRVARVIIVPHRFLHLVPFHAMTLPDGRLWGDAVIVQYAPSASVLCRLLRTEQAGTEAGRCSQVAVGIIGPARDRPGSDIAFSQEILAVTRTFGGAILDGRKVGLNTIIDSIEEADYIHFACHGSFERRNPLDGGLECADADLSQRSQEDREMSQFPGRLTLGQIFERVHFHRSPVVVLSACETGLSKVEESYDEYLGLPAALLYAGAKTVISTFWPVADPAVQLLMGKMSREIVAGMSAPEALRAAQFWLRSLTLEDAIAEITALVNAQGAPNLSEEVDAQCAQLLQMAEPFPFAGPYWWAGFAVNGLG
jgi:CHAT domain-containing protein/tetratricopeptide (TPR) repeat protein